MVKATRDEAERRGVDNIQFHQCSAAQQPFPDNTFDAAVSRLSAMFFPDVSAGLGEILRVVKPGGYLSFLVWAPREANPFFSVVADVLARFVPSEPEDEDAPGAFRFARSGKLATLLEKAGASAVKQRSVVFNIEAPMSVELFWELRTEMSDTFRTKLAKLSTEEVAAMREEVTRAVAGYFKTGSMRFPSEALTVTGRKPEV
jgi:ubiquinone/menaquinone biosynthesis C-methylase UbiE